MFVPDFDKDRFELFKNDMDEQQKHAWKILIIDTGPEPIDQPVI